MSCRNEVSPEGDALLLISIHSEGRLRDETDNWRSIACSIRILQGGGSDIDLAEVNASSGSNDKSIVWMIGAASDELSRFNLVATSARNSSDDTANSAERRFTRIVEGNGFAANFNFDGISNLPVATSGSNTFFMLMQGTGKLDADPLSQPRTY